MALKALALNLRPEDYDRVLAHVERLGRDPVVRSLMGEVSIASVGRMALVTGLDALDAQHGVTPPDAPAVDPDASADAEPAVSEPIVVPEPELETAPTGDGADDLDPFGGAS